MQVLILSSMPTDLASSRVRVGQYLPLLAEAGVGYRAYAYLLSGRFSGGGRNRGPRRTQQRMRQVASLVRTLQYCQEYDVILLQKVVPPLWFQKILIRTAHSVVFDFDDAIFAPPLSADGVYPVDPGSLRKLRHMLARCSGVIAGNEYLADYARQFNAAVYTIPSAVDTAQFAPSVNNNRDRCRVIGWAGSGDQHLPHLSSLKPALDQVCARYPVTVRLIGVLGSHRFEELFRSANYPVEYVDWVDYEKLPEQLAEFDIGVMPLLDDAWARGKCGYKALLYMSCGIPTVCSPVGVNREIIEDGVNGFLAESTEDWANKLGRLVDDAELRRRFAEKGRKTVVEEFSVRAVFPEFLSALRMQARLR